MIKVCNVAISGLDVAMRGMRNPLDSWEKSDSYYEDYMGSSISLRELVLDDSDTNVQLARFIVGDADKELALKLIKSGSDHRKFMRQIIVSMDIVAPLYWWKEFDTYKVGTVANSCSTMHKLGSKALSEKDFSWDNEEGSEQTYLYRNITVDHLNLLITELKSEPKGSPEYKDKWRQLIQDLPSSFNQRRTVTFTFENARNMYFARKNHKQREWRVFVDSFNDLYCGEFITE